MTELCNLPGKRPAAKSAQPIDKPPWHALHRRHLLEFWETQERLGSAGSSSLGATDPTDLPLRVSAHR